MGAKWHKSELGLWPLTVTVAVLLLVLAPSIRISEAASVALPPTGSTGQATCRSLECVTLAADMASMLNQSVNPCEDFYGFACGNFPNVVMYNPLKVEWYERVGDYLFEDSSSLMVEKLEKKVYELLILDRLAFDSDPDMRDLYNLTSVFFRSCTEWVRNSETDSDYAKVLSVSLLRDAFSHLMQGIEPSRREGMQLEEILATIVRAGSVGMVTVELPDGFAVDALSKESDMINITKAKIGVSERFWRLKEHVQFFKFFKENEIIGSLTLSNITEASEEISSEVQFSKFVMYETLMEVCSIKSKPEGFTVAELDALSECAYKNNSFSWTLFFEELLQSPIDTDAKIQVENVWDLLSTVNFFKKQPVYAESGIHFSMYTSYLIFDWFLSFGDFFPTGLREEWKKEAWPLYPTDGVVTRSKSGRITDCMMKTKYFMQPIVERMYRAAYHPGGFKDVKNIIHLLKGASIESVRRQNWITPSSKEAIVKKIRWMQHSIGLDELTTLELKEFYNKTLTAFRAMDVSPNLELSFGSLLSVVMCARARKNFHIMSGSSPVSIFMDANPLEVNAFNYIESNRIIFPMGILAPPVYHPSYPAYITLGNLGYTIGHEIGHSFDDAGHEITRMGATGHFWDNETEANYLERMECVRSCYGNYTLYPGGPVLMSNSTLGNDISDIIGLKAAFDALQMVKRRAEGSEGMNMQGLPNLQANMSSDQLFFIQAAQGWCLKAERSTLVSYFGGPSPTHSPNHLRVIGMMQNSLDFARTFSCQSGQAMHPKRKKCTFW